jgi:hypothetical protein
MADEEDLKRLDEEAEAYKRAWKDGYMVGLCCSCRRCVPLGKRRKSSKAVTFFGCLLWRNGYGLRPLQIIGDSEVCRRTMCEVWRPDRRKLKV